MIQRSLPVKSNDAEFALDSKMLARTLREIDALEEEKKASNTRFKTEIDAKYAEVTKLRTVVETRMEDRLVECREEPDFGRSVVLIIRMDTGETVDTRPIEQADRQTELSVVDGEKSRSK